MQLKGRPIQSQSIHRRSTWRNDFVCGADQVLC